LKSLKELQAPADNRPFAVEWRRYIAALYRKAQRGDPDALRILLRLQEMQAGRRGTQGEHAFTRGPADAGLSRITDDLSFPGGTSPRLNLLRDLNRRPPTPRVDRGMRGTGWTLQRQRGGIAYLQPGGRALGARGRTPTSGGRWGKNMENAPPLMKLLFGAQGLPPSRGGDLIRVGKRGTGVESLMDDRSLLNTFMEWSHRTHDPRWAKINEQIVKRGLQEQGLQMISERAVAGQSMAIQMMRELGDVGPGVMSGLHAASLDALVDMGLKEADAMEFMRNMRPELFKEGIFVGGTIGTSKTGRRFTGLPKDIFGRGGESPQKWRMPSIERALPFENIPLFRKPFPEHPTSVFRLRTPGGGASVSSMDSQKLGLGFNINAWGDFLVSLKEGTGLSTGEIIQSQFVKDVWTQMLRRHVGAVADVGQGFGKTGTLSTLRRQRGRVKLDPSEIGEVIDPQTFGGFPSAEYRTEAIPKGMFTGRNVLKRDLVTGHTILPSVSAAAQKDLPENAIARMLLDPAKRAELESLLGYPLPGVGRMGPLQTGLGGLRHGVLAAPRGAASKAMETLDRLFPLFPSATLRSRGIPEHGARRWGLSGAVTTGDPGTELFRALDLMGAQQGRGRVMGGALDMHDLVERGMAQGVRTEDLRGILSAQEFRQFEDLMKIRKQNIGKFFGEELEWSRRGRSRVSGMSSTQIQDAYRPFEEIYADHAPFAGSLEDPDFFPESIEALALEAKRERAIDALLKDKGMTRAEFKILEDEARRLFQVDWDYGKWKQGQRRKKGFLPPIVPKGIGGMATGGLVYAQRGGRWGKKSGKLSNIWNMVFGKRPPSTEKQAARFGLPEGKGLQDPLAHVRDLTRAAGGTPDDVVPPWLDADLLNWMSENTPQSRTRLDVGLQLNHMMKTMAQKQFRLDARKMRKGPGHWVQSLEERQAIFWQNWLESTPKTTRWEDRHERDMVAQILSQMERDLGVDPRDVTDIFGLNANPGTAGMWTNLAKGDARGHGKGRVNINPGTLGRVTARMAGGAKGKSLNSLAHQVNQQYLKALIYEEFLHGIDNLVGIQRRGVKYGGNQANINKPLYLDIPYASAGVPRAGLLRGGYDKAWGPLGRKKHPFQQISDMVGPVEQKRLALLAEANRSLKRGSLGPASVQGEFDDILKTSEWASEAFGKSYFSRPTERFAKMGSLREAYGPEAIAYILGPDKLKAFEEAWALSKIEMQTLLNTTRPLPPHKVGPGGTLPGLGRARGGLVYAEDGWAGLFAPRPLGKPNVPYDDPFGASPRVRPANIGRSSILAALKEGNATALQYNEAWKLAEKDDGGVLEALHSYDIKKQRDRIRSLKFNPGPTRAQKEETSGQLQTRVMTEQWLRGKGVPQVGTSLRWTGSHRRLWDHEGNRLVEGMDPQTGLMKGATWVRIGARKKAIESQSIFQDYVPEMFYTKKDFPSSLEDLPYTVKGQREFEHAYTPGSMNKLGKAFQYISGDPILSAAWSMLEGGEMMTLGAWGFLRGATGTEGIFRGMEDPIGQVAQLNELLRKWEEENPRPPIPRDKRGGIKKSALGTLGPQHAAWEKKRREKEIEFGKLWTPRGPMRILDDGLRGANRAMYDPSWADLPFGFAAPYNRGGLVYAQDGGSIFGNRHLFKPKGTDTIPAMLSPGEFVVRRDAVNAVGVDTLRHINSMGGGNGAMTAQRGGMVYAQGGLHIDDKGVHRDRYNVAVYPPGHPMEGQPMRELTPYQALLVKRPKKEKSSVKILLRKPAGDALSMTDSAMSDIMNLKRQSLQAEHDEKQAMIQRAVAQRETQQKLADYNKRHGGMTVADKENRALFQVGPPLRQAGPDRVIVPPSIDTAMQDIKASLGRTAEVSLPPLAPIPHTDATVPRTPTRFPPPGHPPRPPATPNIPFPEGATPDRLNLLKQLDRKVPGRPPEERTGAPARVPFREGMRVPHMNIPFPEGATPERMDLLGQLDRRTPTPRGVVPKLPKTAGPRRARTALPEPVGAGMDAEAIAFVEEQKRRTALINKLGPEALQFLRSRIPLTTVNAAPEGTSDALWKALGNKTKRISSWDIIPKERFESLYTQALEYTQGQDAKRKALGYGLGSAFADRHKNATPAERAEFDNQQVAATAHQKRRVFLETVLRRWLPETGLLGKRGTGTGTYDEEKRIPKNPDELIRDWVLKWGNGDLNRAIENRRAHDDKLADEKFKGKEIKGIEAGARPGLFVRGVDGRGPLIKDRSERGRARFGGGARGAGTVAQGRASAGVVGRKPGAMTVGRFDQISATRAAKERVEAEKAKARTAKLRKRQRQMRRKDELEERRKAAGLPPGATRDEIISAESQLEFLEKARSGDPEQLEKLGFGHTAPGTALDGKFIYDLIKLSESMIQTAMEPLYPAFNPKHKKGQRPKRPQGLPARGGPFIDYKALPGPGLITQQMWDEFGKFESEAGDDPVAQRDKRFVDAFGKPGGPGYYVEKAAWMTAYAMSELKRQKRDRYRTLKGTGERIKVGGRKDKIAKGVHMIRGPQNLKPGTPAHTRAMERRKKGMARANARNSKRLAGINKIRAKKGLAPLGPDHVNEWGVPLMGWKDARSALLKKDVTLLDPDAVTVAAPSAPHVAAPELAQQRLPTAEEAAGLELDELALRIIEQEELQQQHLRPRGLPGTTGAYTPPPAPPLPGTVVTPEPGPPPAPPLPTNVVTPRLLDPMRPITAAPSSPRVIPPGSPSGDTPFPGDLARQPTEAEFMKRFPNIPFPQGITPEREDLRKQLEEAGGEAGRQRRQKLQQAHRRPTGLEGIPIRAATPPAPPVATDFRMAIPDVPFPEGVTRVREGLRQQLDRPPWEGPRARMPGQDEWLRQQHPRSTEILGVGLDPTLNFPPDTRSDFDELEELRRRKGGPMSAGDVRSGAFRMNRGGYIPGYNTGGNVDSVLGALTPGEFVMRREAVRKYGERFMNDLNLQKLNQGGGVGGPVGGGAGGGVSQAKDLERGAALAGESILAAFTQGSQMVGDAIRAALAPENLASQIGSVIGQTVQESLAATSIDLKGNMGVDVRLSGNGAAGDVTAKVQDVIKNAIAGALNSRTNVDGSSKDPSLHQPNV
jgi:hypothetical protein